MKSFQYVITDEMGLHARPAGLLVKEAKNYDSEITITKGDTVTITINGGDEEAVYTAMKNFFSENL